MNSSSKTSSTLSLKVSERVTPASVHPAPLSNSFNGLRNSSAKDKPADHGAQCDCFGKARVCKLCEARRGLHANRAGTSGYRAPETLMLYEYQTTAVDVWAAGVVFISLLSKRYPFMKSDNEETALAQIVTLFGSEKVSIAAKRLGKKVICKPTFPALDLQKLCESLARKPRSNSVNDKDDLSNDSDQTECKVCCCSVEGTNFNQCLCLKSSDPAAAVPHSQVPTYDLLYKLLSVDCFQRISAEAALNHEYFVDRPS